MLDTPLTLLQAHAVFLGWNPDRRGPVDEASDADLERFIAGADLSGRFSVNGEDPCTVDELIAANLYDPEILGEAGRLTVGERAGGGAGGDVVRLPNEPPDAIARLRELTGIAGDRGADEIHLVGDLDNDDGDLAAAVLSIVECALLRAGVRS